MSLQLHRPDGQGGIEPRPVARAATGAPAAVAALGRGRRERPAAGPQEPRDEPDVAAWIGRCSGSASAPLTFVILVAGYGTGFWS